MFGEMRNALSISKEVDILEHIYSLPTPEDRENAMVRDKTRPPTGIGNTTDLAPGIDP